MSLFFFVMMLLLALLALLNRSIFALIFWTLGALVFGYLTVHEFRSFRFRVTDRGLDIYHAGIRRPMPWSDVDALILEQPVRPSGRIAPPAPRLLLVPKAGSGLAEKLDARSPLDDRPARVLLETDDVRQSADDIAAALARYAGDRFTDVRDRVAPMPDFTMVLRGYDPAAVEALLTRARTADTSADEMDRITIVPELLEPDLPVVSRGYDRGQVDAHLAELARRMVV
jgi:hypothetical protein